MGLFGTLLDIVTLPVKIVTTVVDGVVDVVIGKDKD